MRYSFLHIINGILNFGIIIYIIIITLYVFSGRFNITIKNVPDNNIILIIRAVKFGELVFELATLIAIRVLINKNLREATKKILLKTEISITNKLTFLFLISGFAALIYQIAWQRVLFATFGVNIESTTIIVSVFMFGLGIGAIAGGFLSKKYPCRLLHLFLLFELFIGGFGIISIPLIKMAGQFVLHGSLWNISLSIYALLSIPTLFMGATLPILAAHFHQYYHHVGKAVGILYSFNTIGSAIACFITVDILFVLFGLQTSVFFAAFCNFLVGIGVYFCADATKPVS